MCRSTYRVEVTLGDYNIEQFSIEMCFVVYVQYREWSASTTCSVLCSQLTGADMVFTTSSHISQVPVLGPRTISLGVGGHYVLPFTSLSLLSKRD